MTNDEWSAFATAAADAAGPDDDGGLGSVSLETRLRQRCLREAAAFNDALAGAGAGAGTEDWREDVLVTWAHMLTRSIVFPLTAAVDSTDVDGEDAAVAAEAALAFARMRRCGVRAPLSFAAPARTGDDGDAAADADAAAAVADERRALLQQVLGDVAAARRDRLLGRVFGDGVRAGSTLSAREALHVRVFLDYALQTPEAEEEAA
jgi:hypothetical protein